MLSNCNGSIPMILLVTDGSVEDERHICDVMKSRITSKGLSSPRVFTFGIGNGFYCVQLVYHSGIAYLEAIADVVYHR